MSIVVDAGLGDGVQDGLVLETEARRKSDAPLDAPVHLPDAVGQALDARQALVELVGLLSGRAAAKRQEITVARLIVAMVTRQRRLPGRGLLGVGDLGGVEARAQQELGKVGDQIADRPDLAGKAVPLTQQDGEADAAAVAEGRKADGDGPTLCHSTGERRGVGRGFEQRIVIARARDDGPGAKIKQRHKEPP